MGFYSIGKLKNGESISDNLNPIIGEEICLTDFSVIKKPFEKEKIFGTNDFCMMNTSERSQNESFVIHSKSNKLIVIDGGNQSDAQSLAKEIHSFHCDDYVDGWYLTHFHSDHIGALTEILTNEKYSSISIGSLFFDFSYNSNLLSAEQLTNEKNELKKLSVFNEATAKQSQRIKTIVKPNRGDTFFYDDNLEVTVLNKANFANGANWVNNSSVCYKVSTNEFSVLFLGDLGSYGTSLLSDSFFKNEISTSDIVQLAHHGQCGCGDSFYKCLSSIKVALYCAPDYLFNGYDDPWCPGSSYLTMHTRKLMRSLGVVYSFWIKDQPIVWSAEE